MWEKVSCLMRSDSWPMLLSPALTRPATHAAGADSRGCGPKENQVTSSSRCTTGNMEMPAQLPMRSPLRLMTLGVLTYYWNVSDKGERVKNMVGHSRFYCSITVKAWHGKENRKVAR